MFATSPLSLKIYVDTAWASCLNMHRSVTRYITFLGSISFNGNCIMRTSMVISPSQKPSSPSKTVTLYFDNKATFQIATNQVFHEHTKHIEINYQFVWKYIISGFLHTAFVSSTKQLVILTKALQGSSKIHIYESSLCLVHH